MTRLNYINFSVICVLLHHKTLICTETSIALGYFIKIILHGIIYVRIQNKFKQERKIVQHGLHITHPNKLIKSQFRQEHKRSFLTNIYCCKRTQFYLSLFFNYAKIK